MISTLTKSSVTGNPVNTPTSVQIAMETTLNTCVQNLVPVVNHPLQHPQNLIPKSSAGASGHESDDSNSVMDITQNQVSSSVSTTSIKPLSATISDSQINPQLPFYLLTT